MIVIVHSNVIVAAAVIVAVVADCVSDCALNQLQLRTLDVLAHGIFYVVCMLHPLGNLYRKAVVLGVLASELAYLRRWAVSHR